MTFKPDTVIQAITEYYQSHPSCHNRSSHELSEITSNKIDDSRKTISNFINCPKDGVVVFSSNATDSINKIANLLSFEKGDVILTSDLEHNSNMLPWQFLAAKKGVKYKQVSISPEDSELNLVELEKALSSNNVKLLSILHVSNVTGLCLDIKSITSLAHSYNVPVLLDAAQSLPHYKVDVQDLGVDFMAFSFHKAFGPTGMGGFYAKTEVLMNLAPVIVGGESVVDTTYDQCTLNSIPERFEVGLQNYAGIIGSGAAIKWLSKINQKKAIAHIKHLNTLMSEGLSDIKGISLIGPASPDVRASIANFSIEKQNSAELGFMLSKQARIMSRSGVHCCHAWFHKYDLPKSLRFSFSFYNTEEEVEITLKKMRELIY